MQFLQMAALALASVASAHSHANSDDTISPSREEILQKKWGSDWPFSGIATFAHLPAERCLTNISSSFDIGLIGVPFDTAVSYRPGARFGPRALRAASMRQSDLRGFNTRAGVNPYQNWAKIMDCMDMAVSPVDNKLALIQMTEGFKELLSRAPATPEISEVPRLVVLGGDHSIVLPHLRALHEHHGEIAVIHFDAHLDTWLPTKYPSSWDDVAEEGSGHFTHGTFFWMAHEEGLLSHGNCIHAGLRTRLSGVDYEDYRDDADQGFARIQADDVDSIGVEGIVKAIKKRVGNKPAYISVDIDVIDPGMAPGTGTPEVGGWTTRELIAMIRGLSDLNIVGGDVVEVSPAFDHAEVTALAGAQIAYEIITNMVMSPVNAQPAIMPKDEL